MTESGAVGLFLGLLVSSAALLSAWGVTVDVALGYLGADKDRPTDDEHRFAIRRAIQVCVPLLVVLVGLLAWFTALTNEAGKDAEAADAKVRAAIAAKYGIPVDPGQPIPQSGYSRKGVFTDGGPFTEPILGRVDGQAAECTLRVVGADPLILCDASKVYRESDRVAPNGTGTVESDRPAAVE